ncbi:MAG: phosphatase PAP2 family protein [Clostridia bacterium]|nr:phosphatase PAP2 family protein [Clostridia bacterium]
MEIEIVKAIQNGLNSNFFDIFCGITSYLSSYLGFIFILAVFFVFIDKKYSIYFGLTYGLGVAFNFALKFLINRPRPYQVDPTIIDKLTGLGASFPSGHSVSATIIVCFVLFYILKRVNKKSMRTMAFSLSVTFVSFVVFSRIYLGQHYLTDTIAGIILGLTFSCLGYLCYTKLQFRKLKR